MLKILENHKTFLRYFLVSLIVLLWDAFIVYISLKTTGTLWIAIILGYSTSLFIAYTIHKKWTFQSARKTTFKGSVLYVSIVAIVGATRIPTAYASTYAGLGEMTAWVISVGVSFILNYILLSIFFNKNQTAASQ